MPTQPGDGTVPLDDLLRQARGTLASAGIEDAALDARLLVSHFSGIDRVGAITNPRQPVPANRVAAVREAGYDRPLYIHGALAELCALYESLGVALGDLRLVTRETKKGLAGEIVLCPPGALADRWTRGFPEPLAAMASGWMRVRQRARMGGIELPLILSDHADWDELTRTIEDMGAPRLWVTHGREDALVYHCRKQGLEAEPLNIQAYEEGEEGGGDVAGEGEA